LSNKIDEKNNEYNSFLQSEVEWILKVSSIEKIKNHVDWIFWWSVFSNSVIQNRLINKAREFVNYGNWEDDDNAHENDLWKTISIKTEDDFKTVVNKMSELYTMWKPEEKIYASRFFTNIETVINTEEWVMWNITRYRWQAAAAIWALWIWAAVWFWVPVMAWLWVAAAAWWIKYLWSNAYDRKDVKDKIWNIWENNIYWKNNFEKWLVVAWPVWWWILATKKAIWWLLWWWKTWAKAAWVWVAWTAEMAWWIIWSVPWFKKVWSATDWWWKWAFNKMFWNKSE